MDVPCRAGQPPHHHKKKHSLKGVGFGYIGFSAGWRSQPSLALAGERRRRPRHLAPSRHAAAVRPAVRRRVRRRVAVVDGQHLGPRRRERAARARTEVRAPPGRRASAVRDGGARGRLVRCGAAAAARGKRSQSRRRERALDHDATARAIGARVQTPLLVRISEHADGEHRGPRPR